MESRLAVWALSLAVGAAVGSGTVSCSRSGPAGQRPDPVDPTSATAEDAAAPARPADRADGGVDDGGTARDAATDGGLTGKPAKAVDISADEAAEIMFLARGTSAELHCAKEGSAEERIRCMLKRRFEEDGAAAKVAVALYDRTGSVAGLEPGRMMDGGWRGMLKLVPELPIGRHRRHLSWGAAALEDFEQFFAELGKHGARPLPYRHKPFVVRYFRSVGRTTPSAYAGDWTVAYNVSGSLHSSAHAVRETFFHEIFHLNDQAHGRWSAAELPKHVDPIVERCRIGRSERLDSRCLAPFAPNHTTVRGGTFYAFQPGNGVWEYAAELAVRYYREHRVILGFREQRRDAKPFKCGPEPNGTTWKLLADEFFGGVDLVPPCR